MAFFRHSFQPGDERVGLLVFNNAHAPQTTAIQLNGLNDNRGGKGLKHRLQCVVASATDSGIQFGMHSTDRSEGTYKHPNRELALATLNTRDLKNFADVAQRSGSCMAQEDQALDTAIDNFVQECDCMYSDLVPYPDMAIAAFVASGGQLPQINQRRVLPDEDCGVSIVVPKPSEPLSRSGQPMSSFNESSKLSKSGKSQKSLGNQKSKRLPKSQATPSKGPLPTKQLKLAPPRFRPVCSALDMHSLELSEGAVRRTNEVLRAANRVHQAEHYLCSHPNASKEDREFFHKACASKLRVAKSLIQSSISGAAFDNKHTDIEMPSHFAESGCKDTTQVPTRKLSQFLLGTIPMHSVKTTTSKSGFAVKGSFVPDEYSHSMASKGSNLQFTTKKQKENIMVRPHCSNSSAGASYQLQFQTREHGVQATKATDPSGTGQPSGPEDWSRFTHTSLQQALPSRINVSVQGDAQNQHVEPYACVLDSKGGLWLQRDHLPSWHLDPNNEPKQLHHFDASSYSMRQHDDVAHQLAASDLLLGPKDHLGRRPKCFKEGTRVVASYPSAACVMARYGSRNSDKDDDVIFFHPHKQSLCDEPFMQALHSGAALAQEMSVRHALARHKEVPVEHITLQPNSIHAVNCARRLCKLGEPLNHANMSQWSSARYEFQGKKLHTFQVGYTVDSPGDKNKSGPRPTEVSQALLQVNTCPSDREMHEPSLLKHGGVQVLADLPAN